MAEKKLRKTDIEPWLKIAKPKAKLSDGGGLHLFKSEQSGDGLWRVRYTFLGKEKTFSIGKYPAISLDAARIKLLSIKTTLAKGLDPVAERKMKKEEAVTKASNTFQKVTEDWLSKKQREWGKTHYAKTSQAFARDILPYLGKYPVSQIEPPHILTVLEKIEKRGAVETARRLRTYIDNIFDFSIAHGLTKENPAPAVEKALKKKSDSKLLPAILDIGELREILWKSKKSKASDAIKMAVRLQAFTATRIENIVAATWNEFDLEKGLWTIRRNTLKKKDENRPNLRIPLHPVLIHELKEWKSLADGREKHLFPSTEAKSGHITKESVEKHYRVTLQLAGKHCPHGWRSSFSSNCNDNRHVHHVGEDVIEVALDHKNKDTIAGLYDRGDRFVARCNAYQWWGDQLTGALEKQAA
jgi:integrase